MASRKLVRLLAAFTVLSTGLAPVLARADNVGDCESGGDAGNVSSAAKPMATPAACSGSLSSAADEDWYRFDTTGTDTKAVQVGVRSLAGAALELRLIDPTGADVTTARCAQLGTNGATCAVNTTAAGAWKTGIRLVSGASGGYAMDIGASPPPPPPVPDRCPGESNGDASNDPSNATPVQTPAECSGALLRGDSDWYSFTVPENGAIALSLAGLNGGEWGTRAAVVLVDPSGHVDQRCPGYDEYPPNPPWLAACTSLLPRGGTWKVGIFIEQWVGAEEPRPYDLTISVGPGLSVPLPSCDNGSGSLTPPTVCTGRLEGTRGPGPYAYPEADEYSLIVPAGATLVGHLSRIDVGMNWLSLFSPAGADVSPQSCKNDPQFREWVCVVPGAAGGTWRARISGQSGVYALGFAPTPAIPPIPPLLPTCEPDGDAGNYSYTATPVSPTTLCAGALANSSDSNDYYSFQVVSEAAAVQVAVQPLDSAANIDVQVTDPGGVTTTSASGGAGAPEAVIRGSAPFIARIPTGTWTVRVLSGAATYPAPYMLTINLVQ